MFILACIAFAPAARAGDISGSARVYAGTSVRDDGENDILSQDYTLRLMQPITPWITLFVSYVDSDFRSEDQDGIDFQRLLREATAQLVYARSTVSAQVGVQDRRNRGTSDVDNFQAHSIYGQAAWNPTWGPTISLRVRDAENEADTAVFGRSVETFNLDFDVDYSRRTWSAHYTYQDFNLKNLDNGYTLDLERHMCRGLFSNQFLDGRIALSGDALVSHDEQLETAGDGADIAEPLDARQILFALDTTPEQGELDPAATLGLGQPGSPARLSIEVGGANLYRNVGLDLGFTRQVSRIEISVDGVSDSGLLWRVYHSPDNLNWDPVAVETTVYEPAFDRYIIRFPQITDRYFKAVNLSTNTRSDVVVTGIRALMDAPQFGRRERRSTNFRGYLQARFLPWERLSTTVNLGYSGVSGTAEGLPLRDVQDFSFDTLVQWDFIDTLGLRLQYIFADHRRDEDPVLRRQEERFLASLVWTPLETVDGLLSASRREESEEGLLLRRSDLVTARATTALYPDLQLTSEVNRSQAEDDFSGYDLASWTWRETLESRPTRDWILSGGFAQTWYDATGRISISRRSSVNIRTDVVVNRYFSCGGDWVFGREDDRNNFTQRYHASWTPGSRLSFNGSYIMTSTAGGFETSGAAANLNYKVNTYLNLFASYNSSAYLDPFSGPDGSDGLSLLDARLNGVQKSEQYSAQIGLILAF